LNVLEAFSVCDQCFNRGRSGSILCPERLPYIAWSHNSIPVRAFDGWPEIDPSQLRSPMKETKSHGKSISDAVLIELSGADPPVLPALQRSPPKIVLKSASQICEHFCEMRLNSAHPSVQTTIPFSKVDRSNQGLREKARYSDRCASNVPSTSRSVPKSSPHFPQQTIIPHITSLFPKPTLSYPFS
jgi:hypothetical protein